MRKTGRDKRPHVKPVTRIELSEKNIKLRWILIVVFLSIAVVSILIGLTSMLNTEPGWQEVEVSSEQPTCSEDFVLMYDFGGSGGNATAEYKQLTALYSEAMANAFRIFSADMQEDGLYNVRYLNDHINQTVTVDEVLYEALSVIAAYDNRSVFLAPAAVEYDRVFYAENDAEAESFDPACNQEMAAYVGQIAAFANDPEMISLTLLGNNQVCLKVADAYLAYAEENEIDTFLDLDWMTNAFIADYIADLLVENGFTCGYLVSYDGFTRNLDSRGNSYSLNIFDFEDSAVNMPARLSYDSPLSIVQLRSYPMSDRDCWHYYAYKNGRITTALLDSADGMSKSSIDDLVAYSEEAGCAELLMQMIPVFIADDFSSEALDMLAEQGIHSVWCEGSAVCHTDSQVRLQLLTDNGGSYTLK